MKAIVVNRGIATLAELPIPQLMREDEAIIRVRLVGLCRTDMYVAQGLIVTKPDIIVGHEFCGDVIAIGQTVQHLAVGQRVGVMPVRRRSDGTLSSLGRDEDGAFAEFVRVRASQAYPLPLALSDEAAAYLEPVAASLAVLRAPITPSMQGLVYGENRIAALTCSILEKAGFSATSGLFDSTTLKQNTYDFIVETVPTEEAFKLIVQALKPGGLFILKSRPYDSVSLPITPLVEKEIRMVGVHYAPFEEAITLVSSGGLDLKDRFGETCSFEEALPILLGKKRISETRKLFFRP